MDDFEKQIHAMFDHIWDCEIEHPVVQETVGELMNAVIQCYNRMPSAQPEITGEVMAEEKNTQEQTKQQETKKESPLANVQPKEIPTLRHTFKYHGESDSKR